MKRTWKIVGIVVAIIVVLAIAIPFFIDVNSFRPTLESKLTEALGRQVSVGNLSLSIFGGSVTAEKISIADDPTFSKSPFVQAKSLHVGVEVMPLVFHKTLNVTDLTLDEPQVVLLHNAAGKWNYSSLGGNNPSKPATQKPQSSSSSSAESLSVKKLAIKDGRVSVGEAGKPKPQVYDHVNLTVDDFSFTSQFPFTLTAGLPGGGDLKLDGKAGPINANDAAMTPFKAQATVKKLDLAASGFVDPGTGIAGVADYSGNVSSDGKTIRTDGTMTADKLKLSPKGTPASKAVQLKYATNYDVASQSGTLTKGDVTLGKALAQLTGTYKTQGETTLLNMKLNAQNMPVDDLTTMLPALGVVLPSGSSLKGGTLTTNLDIAGPADKLVITGPIRLADTRLAGFDMGSKMSAITKLTGGGKSGSDTVIQNLSTNARVAPEGIRTDAVNLVVPSLGTVVGAGTISPEGALNYKMSATLSGGAAQTAGQLTQLAGIKGGGSAGLPFFIQGTTSNPQFVPDVQGMAQSQVKGALGGVLGNGKQKGSSPTDALGGIFGKKKKN